MRTQVFPILITIAAAMLATSCGLLQTRDPESPSDNQSSFKPAVSAEIVLENFASSVGETNADNYARSFSDTTVSSRSYSFIPSAEVAAGYSSLFAQWGAEDELRYFRNIGKPSDAIPSLTFARQRQLATSSDSVIYNMDYVLYFPHARAGIPELFRGNMQLHLAADSRRQWSIYRWQDFKTTSDSTWSYLKAVYGGN